MTPAVTVDGDVVAVHSYWTDDHSQIMTDATVRTAEGDVVVTEPGGSVDGVGSVSYPGPVLLVTGMTVAVAGYHELDAAQQDHVVLESVKVLAYPPDYVRTTSVKTGHPIYWESGCVFMTVDSAGTTAIAGDGEFPIIDAAISEWNTKTASCSYIKLMNDGRKAAEVGSDGINLIKFRDTVWPHPEAQAAAAITTARFIDDANSSRNGAILDADIELNGVNFNIATGCNGSPATCQSLHTTGQSGFAELQNTLTHELGHVLGLEHPCLAQGDPQRVDNLGNAVPNCSFGSDPPRIADVTMYNFQTPGEIKKESLAADDILGVCDIYPTAKTPQTCDHASPSSGSGGCCSASGPRPDVSFLLAGTTLLIVLRRRRTSRTA